MLQSVPNFSLVSFLASFPSIHSLLSLRSLHPRHIPCVSRSILANHTGSLLCQISPSRPVVQVRLSCSDVAHIRSFRSALHWLGKTANQDAKETRYGDSCNGFEEVLYKSITPSSCNFRINPWT